MSAPRLPLATALLWLVHCGGSGGPAHDAGDAGADADPGDSTDADAAAE